MTLRRLLTVVHETTLTGAPMNLLHFVSWVTANTDVEVHTLVLRDGPLRHRFEQVSDVTVLDPSTLNSLLAAVQEGLVHLGSRRGWKAVAAARFRPQLRHLVGFDVAYFNSVTSIGVQPYLPPARAVVSHVHELDVALKAWRPSSDYELFRTVPDRWLAASGAVRDLLAGDIGIDPDRVSLHYEFIDTAPIVGRDVSLRTTERFRRECGIPAEAAVVMSAGTVDWRKGPDLFVQLAAEVRRRTREPVHFVWVGGDLTGMDMHRLRSDVERAATDHVHFVGVKPDPIPWFEMADVFVLTSREDPFPLVCLEHAVMEHPIVTYRNGGMVELLEAAGPEAAAGIVDHLDVGAMADRVIDLLGSPRLAATVGRQLGERVRSHHDVGIGAPALLGELVALANGLGAGGLP